MSNEEKWAADFLDGLSPDVMKAIQTPTKRFLERHPEFEIPPEIPLREQLAPRIPDLCPDEGRDEP